MNYEPIVKGISARFAEVNPPSFEVYQRIVQEYDLTKDVEDRLMVYAGDHYGVRLLSQQQKTESDDGLGGLLGIAVDIVSIPVAIAKEVVVDPALSILTGKSSDEILGHSQKTLQSYDGDANDALKGLEDETIRDLQRK